ncbi:uncharacterized protein LOC107003863 [Solanum pennellii]|uniref:Uncharacterized protein LOC107003863 n=1 Tax=Solanum pennellii TaxID=28526 RepID=A0ABM1FJ39_SOLPN|nr:uncharacterized protein LOC107003863 [Solanum pennellii]
MIIILRAKSKLGFMLGTCKKNDYTPELDEQWGKCNAFVLAWIINTVPKELLSGIVYASDAAILWENLKERFYKVDGSMIYQLHRDICTIHQGKIYYGYRNAGQGDGDRGDYAARGTYNGKNKVNWNLFCEHCKLHGHTTNICYKLVGYPEDWNFKKNNTTRGVNLNKGKGLANNVQIDKCTEEDAFGIIGEGHKIDAQKLHDVNSENYDAMNVNNNNEMFGTKGYWIVDSGATCHMTCKPEKLSNISENNKNTGRRVYLPNGQITLVTHSGSCMIPDGGALDNVLVDLFNGKVKGIGKEFEGLYYFPSAYQTKANDDVSTANERCLLTKTESQSLRWHYRMGHLSFRVLKELYKMPTGLLQGLSPYEVFHKITPQLDHLRTIGCLCYATKSVTDDKFSSKADACDHYVPVFPAQPFLDSDTTVVTTSIENGGETEPIHDMVHDVVNDDHDQIVHTEVVAVDVPRTSFSKRTVYPPVWMKDCVTNVSDSFHPHSLSNYISYDHLSSTYQAYLSGMSVDIEPNTYEESLQDKRWIEAMK